MQKTKKMHSISKAIGLLCAVVMLVCALYVPMVFSASAIASVEIADNTPVVFDFEDTVNTGAVNKAEALGEAGIGYYGWGPGIKTYTNADGSKNTVLIADKTAENQYWATQGGYRLHKKLDDGSYGFYELQPATKYVVSFKIRVMASPYTVTGSSATAKATVSIGYNSKYDPNASGQSENYVNSMGNSIPVMSSVIDSDTFSIFDENGKETKYNCGEEWINVRYFINTPAEFEADPALAFWATKYTGINCEIDDVSVVKIGADSGMVILVDEYSGAEEMIFGKIGTAVTLPDISDRAQSADHAFEGWYIDVDRTEKAENVTFTNATQTIYSRWKAPVSITFKDALNNTEKTITGSAGDKFNYPADPVDPSNESWFMGWYIDEGFTNEYTSGKFGYANMTLYAYFKGKIPGLEVDFEDYNIDAYTVQRDENGQAYKSNRLIFGATLSKQSDVTYNNSNYAVKFAWNPVQIEDKDNEHRYDTARYKAKDNYFQLGRGLEEGQLYVVTFKYKAEKVNAPVNFYMITSINNNGWANRAEYTGINNFAIKQSDEWQEASFYFTPAYNNGADYVHLGVSLTQNEETVIYFDDVKVEAFAQPYESVVHLHTNIDKEVINIKGVRGEEIEFPVIEHPMGSEFKGWYTDSEFTNPLEITTFQRGEIDIYAKWLEYSGFVQGFENYTQDAWTPMNVTKDNGTPDDKSDDFNSVYKSNYLYFYTTLSKQGDVVHSGNNAIKFHWNTDPSTDKDVSKPDGKNINNPESYEHKRYASWDNYFPIGTGLQNNQVYTITFNYKVEKGDQNVQFYLLSANGGNAWGSRTIYTLPETFDLKPGDWQEYTFEFTTAMKSSSDHLFLGVVLSENEDAIIYFDDITVKSVLNNEEMYVFVNNGYEPGTIRHVGIKGEKINLPPLNHPDDAEFLGWFTDPAFTTPFTLTEYPEENVSIYAKWAPYAMTFKTYPYEGHNYTDPFINRETAKGLGNGDDHAMHWKLKRVTDNTGGGTGLSFQIYSGLEDGAIYKVKYDYKISSACTLNGAIEVMSADVANIWWTNIRTTYVQGNVPIKAGQGTGWETKELYINANVIESGGYQKADDLFIRFNCAGTGAAGVNMDILIDNVYVEKVEAPYVYFDGLNGKNGALVEGKAGEAITLPAAPVRIGYDFAGWYLDKECTIKFDLTTFAADTAVNAYAKWNKSNTSVYSFENYTCVEGVGYTLQDGEAVKRNAKTGSYSMYFGDRTPGNYNSRSYFTFEDGGEYFELEKDTQYVVTFNYYVKEVGISNLNVSFIASLKGNIYTGLNGGVGAVSVNQPITVAEGTLNKNKWAKKTFAVDTSLLANERKDSLISLNTLITGGENWEIYFDDIAITKVPKGQSLVVFDTMGAKGCPDYIIGKPGTNYSAKVPESLTNGDMYFKGYFNMSVDGAWLAKERSAMSIGEKAEVLFGRFLDRFVEEDFEDDFYYKANGKGVGYTIHDFDYEVYDSEKEGNSKDNVTSGRYSLHRKGTSMFNENSVVLTLGNQIAEGERYTVTFKVKLGKHFHTDGAVKIVSSRSYEYAWTTTGDYYAVAPIADLTDGQWHEVSYTFNSVEAFITVQTPGYVELFMDDFKFTLVDSNTPLSEPPVYTEYVAAERDANGNLLKKDRTAVDISTIIDASLGEGGFPWIWVIIGAAIVLVLAGGAVAFILIKKKKSQKV